jgi:hypothetical protein
MAQKQLWFGYRLGEGNFAAAETRNCPLMPVSGQDERVCNSTGSTAVICCAQFVPNRMNQPVTERHRMKRPCLVSLCKNREMRGLGRGVKGLKIRRPSGLGGSTPPPGTNHTTLRLLRLAEPRGEAPMGLFSNLGNEIVQHPYSCC